MMYEETGSQFHFSSLMEGYSSISNIVAREIGDFRTEVSRNYGFHNLYFTTNIVNIVKLTL
jgi:hypothetical protein